MNEWPNECLNEMLIVQAVEQPKAKWGNIFYIIVINFVRVVVVDFVNVAIKESLAAVTAARARPLSFMHLMHYNNQLR